MSKIDVSICKADSCHSSFCQLHFFVLWIELMGKIRDRNTSASPGNITMQCKFWKLLGSERILEFTIHSFQMSIMLVFPKLEHVKRTHCSGVLFNTWCFPWTSSCSVNKIKENPSKKVPEAFVSKEKSPTGDSRFCPANRMFCLCSHETDWDCLKDVKISCQY